MIGEVDIVGIFISPLLLCLITAFIMRLLLSRIFDIVGVYGFVWNRPLFDLSIFLILLGLCFTLLRIFTTS